MPQVDAYPSEPLAAVGQDPRSCYLEEVHIEDVDAELLRAKSYKRGHGSVVRLYYCHGSAMLYAVGRRRTAVPHLAQVRPRRWGVGHHQHSIGFEIA
jgi:hypothetical protein